MNSIRAVTTYFPHKKDEGYEGYYDWDDVSDLYAKKFADNRWIFRGQDCVCRDFKSSIERTMKEFGYRGDQDRIERNLIREFKRRADNYLSNPPSLSDDLQWLALMRHYGAPTRLLDWTYSFWVAAYFAVESPNPHFDYEEGTPVTGVPCKHPTHAIWAINARWLGNQGQSIFKNATKTSESDYLKQDGTERSQVRFGAFLKTKTPMAYPVNPFRLNERIVAQQSVFLCPSRIDLSFDDNLASMNPPEGNVLCVRIAPDSREIILRELERMNVNRAVLFPGLEGFANSLKTWMADNERALSD